MKLFALLLLLLASPSFAVDVPAASGRAVHGAFLYSPADRVLYTLGYAGGRTVATDVSEVVPDGLDGLYVFGVAGLSHCRDAACVPLRAGLSFSAKVVRAGGKLYGTSETLGTWLCEPASCKRLTPAFFSSSWPGAFDATGFWGSGPSGTFRCGDSGCRLVSKEPLEILFSVGTVPGLAWGGSRTGGTWLCTETSCEAKGGAFWYNTYAFDAAGDLYGSSGFPDSTYVCTKAGCAKIDDKYRYWHGPDARGGMLASTQVPAETHLCIPKSCVKVADGAPKAYSVIGPVGSSAGAAAPSTRETKVVGFESAVRGDDGAVYGVRASSFERLERRAVVPERAATVVRVEGEVETVLSFAQSPRCWSWEHDEDAPSKWESSCALY